MQIPFMPCYPIVDKDLLTLLKAFLFLGCLWFMCDIAAEIRSWFK